MGWEGPNCISHLIRDRLVLEVKCSCGHVAHPDLLALREALWRKCGGERLEYIRSSLVCAECGAGKPTYRLLKQLE
jgi:rubredoxin